MNQPLMQQKCAVWTETHRKRLSQVLRGHGRSVAAMRVARILESTVCNDRQPWVFRRIHRLPRPRSHPCPEPHERAQPLQFEAPNARNARKSTITGMSTAAFAPTGGVAQPVSFPIAKSVRPNPMADPATRRRQPRRVWGMPRDRPWPQAYGRSLLMIAYMARLGQRRRSLTWRHWPRECN